MSSRGHSGARPSAAEMSRGRQQARPRRQVQEDMAQYDFEVDLPMSTKAEIDLIPDPELTAEEQMFSREERERRMLIKKCRLVRCYNFYTLEYLLSILSPANRTIGGTAGNVIVSHANGIEDFHITWYQDLDKIFLLSRWLTSEMIDADFIQPVDAKQDLVGTLVAAAYGPTGFWQRAKILDIQNETGVATVQYVDSGVFGEVLVAKLRYLPLGLGSILPYALKCKLAGVPITQEVLEDNDIRREFLWEVGGSDQLYSCKLTNYSAEDDQFSVHFKLVTGPAAPIDFNKIARKKFRSQRRVETGLVKVKVESELASNLLYVNREIDIPSFSSVKMKGLKIFRITHVNSLTDFSVEYVMDYYGVDGHNWNENIQTFYNDATNLFRHKLSSCRPLIGRCYVVHAGPVYKWQRCRLLDRHDEYSTTEVLLVDLGTIMKFPFASLHEIEPQFTSMCSLGFRAYLVDIVPIDGTDFWSKESIDAFRTVVDGKWFHGVVIEHEIDDEYLPKVPQMNYRLGVILVEKKHEGTAKVTLNAELCLRKLARAAGLAAGSALITSDETVFHFDDMKAMLTDNSGMNVDQSSSKVAENQVGHSKEASNSFAQALPPKGKGNLLPAQAQSFDSPEADFTLYYKYFKPETEVIPTNLMQLPKEIRESMAVCSITFVATPSCFYIQMMDQVPDLRDMTSQMELQLTPLLPVPPHEIVVGLSVGVLLFDENEAPTWYRGIIHTPLPKISLAKVILVDFGNEVAVKYAAIRHLPPYFCSIPAFAHRVHLDVKGLIPKGGLPTSPVWSTEAIDSFRKYLALWQDQSPIYYIWRHPESPTITLDSYGQELCYNPELGTWMKRAPLAPYLEADLGPGQLNTNGLLLRNLCRSIGVDVAYERISSDTSHYQFAKAWEILIKRGVAHLPGETDVKN